MTPTSIYQSFKKPLSTEDFLQPPPNPHHTAHKSGRLTVKADPPKLGLLAPFDQCWAPHAKEVLKERSVRSKLCRQYLAAAESSTCLETEADVAEAAASQIINPVNLALCARYPGITKCLSQQTVTRGPKELVRSDKSWLWKDASQGSVFRGFAVLEYKRPGTIRQQEFQRGVYGINQFAGKRAMVARQKISLFKGNSRILLQQATNYADMYNTRYVALFDWQTMILIYFGNQRGNSAGEWCHITVVEDDDDGKMGCALLGFLNRAYRSARYGEASLPPFP